MLGMIRSNGGIRLHLVNTNVHRVTTIGLETLKITELLPAGQTPHGMAWSPIVPCTH